MKILIGYFIDGKHSGIDKYILSLIESLEDKDIKMELLTNKIEETLNTYRSDKVSFIEIPRLRHPWQQYKKMNKILKENYYDIAYFNISETFNLVGIYAAHKNKVLKIIIHSHSSGSDCQNLIKRKLLEMMNRFFKHFIAKWGNCYLACSKKAALWLYPKKLVESNQVKMVYNAVDAEKFKYNEEIRNTKRKELGLESKRILGHVGNFCYQKNQEFLLELIKRLDGNYHLVLVGTGNDFETVQKKIIDEQLTKKVTLLGVRNDVNELLQAFDIFLLPSRFEGLPIVGVEAQFSGLPCIFSDKITEEILLTENSVMLPLDIEKWKEQIELTKEVRKSVQPIGENLEPYKLENQKKQLLEILK